MNWKKASGNKHQSREIHQRNGIVVNALKERDRLRGDEDMGSF